MWHVLPLLFLPLPVPFLDLLTRYAAAVAPVVLQSGRRKTREPKEENVTLGPTVREGEYVFGVAHIFASFNDTFIVSRGDPSPLSISISRKRVKPTFAFFVVLQHVTDLSGRETLVRITGKEPSYSSSSNFCVGIDHYLNGAGHVGFVLLILVTRSVVDRADDTSVSFYWVLYF
jgi:hypothetical protein